MYDFSQKKLSDILTQLHEAVIAADTHEIITFKVLNPDSATSTYNGNTLHVKGNEYIYRGYKTWVDMAHQLYCRMLTPQIIDEHFVEMRFEKLSQQSFHGIDADKEEKYGKESIFSQIHKNEESGFVYYFMEALKNVHFPRRKKVLNLGVNHADEFELLQTLYPKEFAKTQLLGVDYCVSAIQTAQKKFQKDTNVTFLVGDINQLDSLIKEKFSLIISIGTLQSSNLNLQKILMSLVQNHITQDGAFIFAFPNCRWIDSEMIYGAKMKNYNFSEMSNLYKDVVWCKKYLQQKKFRVTITGKDYIFLTATSIKKQNQTQNALS